MPIVAVTLKSGVDTQQTPVMNETGISVSQLIRYKNSLVQTYGGWQLYYSLAMPSTIRSLHAWQGSDGSKFLSAAGTASVSIIRSGANQDITPQTLTHDSSMTMSISSGSSLASIHDMGNSGNVGTVIYFNTPYSIGNLFFNGPYEIVAALSSIDFQIASTNVASTTISSGGSLPGFNTSSGSAIVTVTIPNNNYLSVQGLFYDFPAPTTVGGLTIKGRYEIATVIDSTQFTILANTQATTTASATMNSSLMELIYYVKTGIQPSGSGFGAGGFGSGGFGTGTTYSGGSGTPITATDWTQDNWGEVLLLCPEDGPIYRWSLHGGTITGTVIKQAPFFNGGIFVSMPQQILVAWRSCQYVSGAQDPLTIRWSDAENYANWTISNATSAGAFRIPTGSITVGGIQCPTFGLISTDLDVWVMQYVGGNVIFNFTRVGTGCGWIGKHACGNLGGAPYWCGNNNFFTLGSNGVVPLPCTVWDAIFQNINTTYKSKVVCGINSIFNEIVWFYPSTVSTGENDSYVKIHIEGQEYEWDYGSLRRTAWIDLSVLGNPIATDNGAFIYQHEMGTTITGAAVPGFRTGWWAITEGNDLSFVDWILPDFQWGTRSGAQDAQIQLTFYSVNYPGDTPVTHGPFTITQATQYINTRIRGRLMSVLVQSSNDAFWRLGKIRFRYAASGRR